MNQSSVVEAIDENTFCIDLKPTAKSLSHCLCHSKPFQMFSFSLEFESTVFCVFLAPVTLVLFTPFSFPAAHKAQRQ